jgi:peptidoglycan/xylan/chitin deacetylase (PgdA/CDA1 family)
MRIPGLKKAKIFSRWVQARLLGGAMILGYHSINDMAGGHEEVFVGPRHFAEQMEIISRRARPLSLLNLMQHLKKGSLPDRSIVITFDDGYADNLSQAVPVLEKYDIPATVFVCSGYLGQEFWWDELERLVLCPDVDLSSIGALLSTIEIDGRQSYTRARSKKNAQTFDRTALHHALYQSLLWLDPGDREKVLGAIRQRPGDQSTGLAVRRALNQDELRQLAACRLIEIGAHTRNHPMLPCLPLQQQVDEIVSDKHELQLLLGTEILGFSYPNGQATTQLKNIVREAGFSYACTSLPDLVRPGCETYQLTRFWPRDVDGDTFMKSLRTWLRN